MDTVKEIRRRKGWSQKDLAEESGVGQDTISGIESGRHEPRPSTLRKLADALDVEVADFFREPAVPLADAPRGAGQAQTSTVDEFEQKLAHVLEPVRAEALKEGQAAARTISSEGLDHATRIVDPPEAEAGKRFLEEFPPDERAAAFGELAVGYARFERANENLEANYTRARDLLQEHDEKIDQLQKQLKQEKEAYARLTQENTRLRQDIAELRSEAEQERETSR